MTVDDRLDRRCSIWARDVGVAPIGTAAYAPSWMLLDWPLPWPRDAKDIEALAPLRAALTSSRTRVQLVVPQPDHETRSVVVHDGGLDADGWFTRFARRAREVPPAELLEAAVALAGGAAGDAAPRENDAGALDRSEDVLICGHGSRDRCCGSMGTALALSVAATGRTVRRTSHTGGHRFAATGVVLPEGTCWGFLDEDVLARVLERRGDVADAMGHYRGSVAFSSPAQQAAEQVAFAAVGWSWLDHRRRAVELGDGRVRVESIDPAGRARAWEVTTGAGRTLPVPDCGRDPADAPKHETEVVVEAALEVPPTP